MKEPTRSLDDLTDIASKTDIRINDRSELGEVMDSLESDNFDEKRQMSSIDFNAILTGREIKGILVVEELVRLGILPQVLVAHKKKRLSVSQGGTGRQQKVDMFRGVQEQRGNGGIMARVKSLFSPRQQ